MQNTYVCLYGKIAHESRRLPSILYLKKNRNVCFYDEERQEFLDLNMQPIDIQGKIIIPNCYIGVEDEFFEVIKNNGGIIPCNLEDYSSIEHWPNYYEPKRKLEIIKGSDLINESVLEKIQNEYGNEIFFKTLKKAYSSKIKIEDLKNDKTLIYAALKLHPEEEFIISEYIDLTEDEIGTKEYRIFVYDNKVLNISRHTEFVLHGIEAEVYNKALEIVEQMKKKGFPFAYVLDLGEYIDSKGKKQIDVIEFNPCFATGHYLYNSFDFIPCDDMLHENIYNVAVEFRDLVTLCKMPDEKYKGILIASKYFSNPGSFAYDLKRISDYNATHISDTEIELGKIVCVPLNSINKEKQAQIGNDIMLDILKSAKEDTELYMKELFFKNIKLNKIPLDENYLCSKVFPSSFEPIDISKPLVVNQDVLKSYIDSHPEDKELSKLLKKGFKPGQ